MLYISTKCDRDAYPASKALTELNAPDGGQYIPYKLPYFDNNQLSELTCCPFTEVVARVLNLFFSTQLNSWDVGVCIGRNPVKSTVVGRKCVISQLWYNPGASFEYAANNLYMKLHGGDFGHITPWARIAIYIAFIFGQYSEMLRDEMICANESFHISVPVGDFSLATAAFYAKSMGLPVDCIVLCSDSNSAMWDLVHRGEVATGLLSAEQKCGLERLVYGIWGENETLRYRAACQRHGVYIVPDEQAECLPATFFGAVIGQDRVGSVISSVFSTNCNLLDPECAVCYAGVQDFRAKTGRSNLTLLFSPTDPVACIDKISRITGISADTLLANRNKT